MNRYPYSRGAVYALLISVLVFACSPGTSPPDSSTGGSSRRYAVPIPPDGKSYFSFVFRFFDPPTVEEAAAWGDTRPFAERIRDAVAVELGGRPPTSIRIHAPWQVDDRPGAPLLPFSAALEKLTIAEEAVGSELLLDLLWPSGPNSNSPGYSGITTEDIASGRFDDYIRQYAKDVRAWGEPVLIRLICQEFNGANNHNCAPNANSELRPADFVAAWQRVVRIFRAEGANNVSWAWITASLPPDPQTWGKDRNIEAYYPGNEYVDWIGVDFYDFGPPAWLEPTYEFSLAHQKPLMIGEFGVRHPGSTLTTAEDQAWLESMFDYFEARPNIKSITYFNVKVGSEDPSHMEDHVYLYGGAVNYHPNLHDKDHRLIAGSGVDLRGTFARRISDPRYVSWAPIAVGAAQSQPISSA